MATLGQLPLYTKVGFRITIVLLLLIGFIILRNCSGAIAHRATSQELQNEYYALGFKVGQRQAGGEAVAVQHDLKNPLLQKVYLKGFRAGFDANRPAGKP